LRDYYVNNPSYAPYRGLKSRYSNFVENYL
jgi:hypothetical protein